MVSTEVLKKEVAARCRVRNGRRTLTCRQAHSLAARLNVSLARIGRLCDAEKVKLVSCKLGCF